jgi:hypothetical protein
MLQRSCASQRLCAFNLCSFKARRETAADLHSLHAASWRALGPSADAGAHGLLDVDDRSGRAALSAYAGDIAQVADSW